MWSGRQKEYLERVATVNFAIDHVKDLFLYAVASGVSSSPVICGAAAIFADEEVLGVVDVLVRAALDALYHLNIAQSAHGGCSRFDISNSWLKVDQDCSWDVTRIITLQCN